MFQKLAPTLMEVHGKELQHAAGVDPSSNITPARTLPQKGSEATHIGSGSSTSQQGPSGAVVNTTTVTDQQEFRTTAEEAYKTFVDPQRIAAFTRAPPKLFEGAHKGGRFELFDGNVAGEYVELDEPKRLVQKWRLKQWPAGHYSTLRIDFDQNDVDHVTLMRVTWNGVPVGQEDITKRNWSEYYIRSIKQTFG